ncbi:MAG: glycoside hydrolase family 43 protein [Oscillospiraceae bacterium]|jgi:hypothetical protein|nr:glycoside hydrolase family 43 protein [Oscillospiraceae bacterium]
MPGVLDIQIRDPYVFEHGGCYYLYGSTDTDIWKADGVGFDVYIAEDAALAEFDGPRPAFRPPEGFWSRKNFWAPEVYGYGGKFYMFATFLPVLGRRGTAVLRAESPLGPFEPWSAGPVTPPEWECLDGTLYIEGGKPYMIFCHEWKDLGDGQICAIPLSEDLRSAAGEAKTLFSASEAPWADPLPGRPGCYVTDGPNLYRSENGALLMLWSSFHKGKYAIGLASCADGRLSGPWRQAEKPLYSDDGGHGMLFKKSGGLFLAIHSPNNTPCERARFLEILEEDGRLSVLG